MGSGEMGRSGQMEWSGQAEWSGCLERSDRTARIGEAIRRAAARCPDRRAIVAPAGGLTYGELDAAVETEAARIRAEGLPSPVLVMERDPVAYLVRFLAILRAGRAAACPPAGVDSGAARRLLEPVRARPLGPEIFYVGLTSGSTGAPKAVLRTHSSWLASFRLMTGLFGRPERVMVPGSLTYSASLIACLHALHEGGTVYLPGPYPSADWIDLIEREAITGAFLVPARLQSLIQAASGRVCRQPVTIVSAGAKLSAATRQEATALFPEGRLFEYYGSAEMGFVSYSTPETGDRRPDAVGRLCPGVECQLRTEDGRAAGPGEPGIIHVRSPYQFAGYADGNGLLEDGWVTVGDWGLIDRDGYLYLLGRREDRLNVGGAKFFAGQVEQVLREHPMVAEAAVVGLPDSLRGQIAGAAVVLRPGADLPAAALRRWCAGKLPRPAVPKRVVKLAALPRNAAGKVDRRLLEQLLLRGGEGDAD